VDLQELKVKFEVDRIQLFLEKLEDAEIEWFWQALNDIRTVFPNIDIYHAGSGKYGYLGFGIKPILTGRVKEFLLVSHLGNNENGELFFKLGVIQALADFIYENDPNFCFEFSSKNSADYKFTDWLCELQKYAFEFGMSLNGQGLLPVDYKNQSLTAAQAVEYLKERYPNTYSGTVHIAAFKTHLGRELALDPESKTPVIICDAQPPEEIKLTIKKEYSETDTRHHHLSTHAKTLQVGNKAFSVIISNLNELENFCDWYEESGDQTTALERKVKEFLKGWPIDRLKNMSIEDYHQAKNIECFITQIDSFDPTQGDPTFACYFDIWEPIGLGDNDKYHNEKPYSWNKRLGDDASLAFETLKQEILEIVYAAQRRDLKAIDQIQFTKGLKWMIAFLYQDFNDPFIIPIVSKVNTKRIGYDHLYPKLPLPEILPLLLADKGEQQFFPYVEKLFGLIRKDYLDNKQKKQQTEELVDDVMTQQPLNRILFGAAGTGKTFHTINHALSIIENKTLESLEDEDRTVLKKRFDEYKNQGQIKFVTFHQSFSYEDFVEGIRAESIEDSEGAKHIEYPVISGVFKSLCDAATTKTIIENHDSQFDESHNQIWKMSLGRAGADEEIYQYCLQNDCVLLGWGDDLDFSDAENKKQIEKLMDENDYSEYRKKYPSASRFVNDFKNKMQKGDLIIVSEGNHKFRAIAEIVGDYSLLSDGEETPDYVQKRAVKWLKTFQPSLAVEQLFDKVLSQQTIYNLANAINFQKLKNILNTTSEVTAEHKKFVLVIDEINRGNISRIFGELITLIEDSKREGADEALSVTLPYSKKEFSVPKNIYLIGTMNSSDRSLTGLDIALRRRFTFVEMPPKAELLNDVSVEGLNIGKLLEVINQRIEVLLDRDHCIGHANFMTLKKDPSLTNLAQIFKQKIIPQLQEYFFDDWSKINMVLNANGMLRSNGIDKLVLFPNVAHESESYFEEQKTWEVIDDVFNSIESFTKIIKH
jgi:5-methylcytosine-specific restriction endonuclease McrBC GTP-binding regulatory subunit McrB